MFEASLSCSRPRVEAGFLADSSVLRNKNVVALMIPRESRGSGGFPRGLDGGPGKDKHKKAFVLVVNNGRKYWSCARKRQRRSVESVRGTMMRTGSAASTWKL